VAKEDVIPAEHVAAITEKYGWSPQGALKNIKKLKQARGFSSDQVAVGFLLSKVVELKRRNVAKKILEVAVRLGKPPKSLIRLENGRPRNMTDLHSVWDVIDLLDEIPADEREDILDGAEYRYNKRSDNSNTAQGS
jgi:hypothetical protein